MKKFIDKTNQENEVSVVKAENLNINNNTLPLAYFSSKEVNPQNSLVITDLSSLIKENNNLYDAIDSSGDSKIFYGNEVGILEDENGSSLFSTKEVGISDLFFSQETLDQKYDQNLLDSEDFVHSYYISRHYTMLNKTLYSYSNINDFLEADRIPSSIKVVDQNGEEFLDKNTRNKKYRILLDPIDTDQADKNNLRPYSIVVLLKGNPTENLLLVYDKVSIVSETSTSTITFGHKESINPIDIFQRSFRRVRSSRLNFKKQENFCCQSYFN